MAGIQGDPVRIPASNVSVIVTSIDVLDEHGNKIGGITSLERRDERTVDRVRTLDSLNAGRVEEMVPHVETVTLDVRGFYVYPKNKTNRQSLLNRLPQDVGGHELFKSLQSQSAPFTVVERVTHPADSARTSDTVYLGCWLSSYARPLAIGEGAGAGGWVIETATIQVSAVESR